jgi:hypothetical protein
MNRTLPNDRQYSLTRHLQCLLGPHGRAEFFEADEEARTKSQWGRFAAPDGGELLPRQSAIDIRNHGPRMSFLWERHESCLRAFGFVFDRHLESSASTVVRDKTRC